MSMSKTHTTSSTLDDDAQDRFQQALSRARVKLFEAHALRHKLSAKFARRSAAGASAIVADLRAETWSRLPLDVMNLLSDCVKQETSTKAVWSQLALVCHGWARFCRPPLFRTLRLETVEDAIFLGSVLRSTTSGWLSNHVEYITFGSLCSLLPPAVERIICRLRRLTTLDLGDFSAPLSTRPSVFASAISLRGPLSRIRALSVISLAGLHFPSFCVLLRLLGSCPTLNDFRLTAVTWNGALDPEELPARVPLLPHIRRVRASRASQFWPLSWVVTMAAVDYRAPLRFDVADVVPRDIVTVARIAELMFDTEIKHAPRHWALPHLNEYVIFTVERTSAHPVVTIEAEGIVHGLSFTVCPTAHCAGSSRASSAVPWRTINTLCLDISMYWACWTVSKLPWDVLGAQWVQLPALASVVIYYHRELFQRDVQSLHAALTAQLPATVPMRLDVPRALALPSPAYMSAAAFNKHLQRMSVPELWAVPEKKALLPALTEGEYRPGVWQ